VIPAFSFLLAWRQLVTRSVTIFGTIGVALSVWAMILVISVLSGFVGEWRVLLRGATPQLLIGDLPDGTSYDEVRALLGDDAAVASIAPRMVHQAVIRPRGSVRRRVETTSALQANAIEHDFVELVGIDPEAEARTTGFADWVRAPYARSDRVYDPERPLFVPASWQRAAALDVRDTKLLTGQFFDREGILLGADRLDPRAPLLPGQSVELFSVRLAPARNDADRESTSRMREIRRILPIAGGFTTHHGAVDQARAFLHIDVLREMLGWDIDFDDPVHEVAVRLVDGADLDAEAARLAQLCRDRFGSARARTWRDINEVFLKAVEQERANIKLAMIATLPVAAFLIYATLSMLVMQKRRDIGILLAMGASPGGILATFLLGGLVIAGVGSGTGSLIGCLSALYLNDINAWTSQYGIELFPSAIYGTRDFPVQLETSWVLQVVIGAFVVAMIAVTLPAFRASRLEPVETLAHE
jgi:lipoprotein-releasing system permease protein